MEKVGQSSDAEASGSALWVYAPVVTPRWGGMGGVCGWCVRVGESLSKKHGQMPSDAFSIEKNRYLHATKVISVAPLSNYETEQSDNANLEEPLYRPTNMSRRYRWRSLCLAAADKNLLEAGG